MKLKTIEFTGLMLAALVTGVFQGHMVYFNTMARKFFCGRIHSHW